jgi:hypothetical protein
MLACMLGKNREIFFPKLDEAQTMTFDSIATNLLHENGYEVLECTTDQEAIEKADNLRKVSKLYPVHYSLSDTSGEKPYEEFYTEDETLDMERLSALGVIIGKDIPNKDSLEKLLENLSMAFDNDKTGKDEIVGIIKEYLPNFEHIETGKSLDSKM